MNIYKDFLPKDTFDNICKLIWSRDFPWFNECLEIGNANHILSPKTITKDLIFKQQHYLFTEQPQRFYSPFFHDIMMPILGQMKFNSVKRVWANNYYKNEVPVRYDYHTDEKYPHIVGLFSLNTCNGYIEFKSGKKIMSQANSLIMFDGHQEHRPVSQTDMPFRTNINIVLT